MRSTPPRPFLLNAQKNHTTLSQVYWGFPKAITKFMATHSSLRPGQCTPSGFHPLAQVGSATGGGNIRFGPHPSFRKAGFCSAPPWFQYLTINRCLGGGASCNARLYGDPQERLAPPLDTPLPAKEIYSLPIPGVNKLSHGRSPQDILYLFDVALPST